MRTNCKRGHPLADDNLDPGLLRFGIRRCKICARVYARKWKRRRREAAAIERGYRIGEKPVCKNGHPRTPENLRPGRSDCLICHREQMMRYNRAKGVRPAIRYTPEQRRMVKREEAQRRNARIKAKFVENVKGDVLFARDNGICGICSNPVDPARWEIDHVVPISRGGEHSYANTQVSHPTCNRRKWACVKV